MITIHLDASIERQQEVAEVIEQLLGLLPYQHQVEVKNAW